MKEFPILFPMNPMNGGDRGKEMDGGGSDELRCRFFQFIIFQLPGNSRKQIINLVGLSGIIKFEKGSNLHVAKMLITFAGTNVLYNSH